MLIFYTTSSRAPTKHQLYTFHDTSFVRPVHLLPSHKLAVSADLVGSTHLQVTLAVSKDSLGHWTIRGQMWELPFWGGWSQLLLTAEASRLHISNWHIDIHQSNKQWPLFSPHDILLHFLIANNWPLHHCNATCSKCLARSRVPNSGWRKIQKSNSADCQGRSRVPNSGWSDIQKSNSAVCWARSRLSKLWLNAQPKVKVCRLLGKVTRSKLWLKLDPKVKFCRLFGKVTSFQTLVECISKSQILQTVWQGHMFQTLVEVPSKCQILQSC